MQNDKTNVLFLSKNWYANLFKKIESNMFASYHIAISKKDKLNLEAYGATVIACFEEEYENLPVNPIDEDFLISSFYGDRTLGLFPMEQRISHLSKTANFIKQLFKNKKYDFLVHETIACEFDEVLSHYAKKNGVFDLTFIHSILENKFFWKSSPYHSSFDVDRLKKTIPNQKDYKLANEYIQNVLSQGHKPQYIYSKNQSHIDVRLIPKWRLLLSLLKLELLRTRQSKENQFHDYVFNYSIKLISNYRNSLKAWIDYYSWHTNQYSSLECLRHKKYVLFPLHFEPEATLLYFAPKFSEQRFVIQEILKNLPLDMVLVVKEHPQQKGSLLSKEYGDLKNRNSNLFLLSAKHDTHELIKGAEATITISGTTGYESLVNYKPTIVFGNVFYDKHPKVIKLESIADLRAILHPANLEKQKPSFKENYEYTAKLIAMSAEGFPNYRLAQNNDKNARNLLDAIEKEVIKKRKYGTQYYIGI